MDMRRLRERAGLRTIDVAFHLGVSESSVRNWETGRRVPRLRLDQFINLIRLYKCTVDELEVAMQESIRTSGEQPAVDDEDPKED